MKKGTLWDSIVRTAEHARAVGSLFSVPTRYTFIEDGGTRFFVRVLAGLQRKDDARKKQDAASKAGNRINPFLPPEKDLVVADISDSHIAVLNKYNVVEHHLLVITRRFEDQDMLLTLPDFEALWLCLEEYDALGFYNGGREAGASQQHKHLQLLPLPLAPEGPPVPISPLFADTPVNDIVALPGLPFHNAFVRLDPAQHAARTTFELYGKMLLRVGLNPPHPSNLRRQSMPYCFVVTREWMLMVPRSREYFEDISLNSLAFAGSFFLRNEQQLEKLKSAGPMNALKSVAVTAVRPC